MRCDYCNVQLTLANDGGYAPYGIPLYVCKVCYQKLKESEKSSSSENRTSEVKK